LSLAPEDFLDYKIRTFHLMAPEVGSSKARGETILHVFWAVSAGIV